MTTTASGGMEGNGSSPSARRPRRAGWLPVVGLFLYYAAIVSLGFALMRWVPGAEEAMVAPIQGAGAEIDPTTIITGMPEVGEAAPPEADPGAGAPTPQEADPAAGVAAAPGGFREAPWEGPFARFGLALFAVVGACALALPVAWVHMFTRRLRYDLSLVHTMIFLPIVVAGVVLVVKNSLALAFALAGIVAGVRFRQKLNEPTEAAYMLLSLGIGLAAGVQALDVALAVSLAFNVVVLVLFRWDLAGVTGLGPMLAMGDPALLPARSSEEREDLRERAAALGEGMKTDGILVIHAADPDAARRSVEISLSGVAKEWRTTEPTRDANGLSRFEVLVRMKKKGDPVDLLGELEERWSTQIAAAEYIPYRSDEDEE